MVASHSSRSVRRCHTSSQSGSRGVSACGKCSVSMYVGGLHVLQWRPGEVVFLGLELDGGESRMLGLKPGPWKGSECSKPLSISLALVWQVGWVLPFQLT